MATRFWLFKSEPTCYSFDDLMRDGTTHWDGVRNYQARNFLRDEIKKGDQVLFYHSNCKEPAVVGICEVVRDGYPDHTAFDSDSDHPDLTSSRENPRWYMVDVEPIRKLENPVSLSLMKDVSDLVDMQLLKRGNRLSVMPLSQEHFSKIISLSE